jgi:hypothetical protein
MRDGLPGHRGLSIEIHRAASVKSIPPIRGEETASWLLWYADPFNEDDHFDFDKPVNNMLAAIGWYASWGYFDPGESNYSRRPR